MKRRLSIALITGLTLLFTANVPAYAEHEAGGDAVGDAQGAGDPRGDINVVTATFVLGHDSVSLGTVANESPAYWAANTYIVWWIGTSDNLRFRLVYSVVQGALASNLFDANNNWVCEADAGYYPQASDPYVASFPNACLGSPEEWAITAEMQYQSESGVTSDSTGACCAVENN